MQSASTRESTRLLLKVQAASGLLFALFLTVHLGNQMLAALGPAAYDDAQRSLRGGYQAPPIELALVILPMLIHAGAGVLRIFTRRQTKQQTGHQAPANLPARLHRISGIILLIFFIGHVTATRGASLVYGVFPGFAGVAFTLRWVPAYFWPYYTGFALAGLYHLIYGLSVALPVLGLKSGLSALRRPALLVPLVATLGLFLILGLLAQGGILADVGTPEKSPYAQLILRLFGSH